jgi:hypothetical protein
MQASDFLIVMLAVVSALVCVLCCAARFGVSRQAILTEQQQTEPERQEERRAA